MAIKLLTYLSTLFFAAIRVFSVSVSVSSLMEDLHTNIQRL